MERRTSIFVWTTTVVGMTSLLTLAPSEVLVAGPGDNAVTSIVSDYDSGIAPALQIQSDHLGAYTNAKNLESLMYSNDTGGSWEIDAINVRNATRMVYVGFTKPIPGTGPNGGAPVAPPSTTYLAQVTTECWNYGTDPTTMAPGSTISCPMAVRFDAGGKRYTIYMNPRNPERAGTHSVNITCIFPTSGTNPCSQWKITPSDPVVNPDGSVMYRSVGQLNIDTSGRGGSITHTNQGEFSFSFLFLITKP